jgi:prophage maintenance system killer protein
MSVVAGRIVAAFRAIGETRIADDIKRSMIAAGHRIIENNPFASTVPNLGRVAVVPPHALRVRAMWSVMRDQVLAAFPQEPGRSANAAEVLKRINDIYPHDAYNSLSIEGFDVTEGLIERVRSGTWDPIRNDSDSKIRNALAAKGYADAFKLVLESVSRVLPGESPGEVAETDLHGWYTALFGPSVRAGIIAAADLAGYRSSQVYIRGANHVPPNPARVSDMMDEMFELLKEETSAAVRAVLGHLIFVHIHPFMDGNGRTSRFLMNLMFVSGGFPWTIVRAEKPRRDAYFTALDKAHTTRTEVEDFARFLREEMSVDWSDETRKAPLQSKTA